MSHLELIEIANEYRRLQRQLEAKTQQLDALAAVNAEAGDFPVDFEGALPRRYSIDFLFQAGDVQPQERDVVVESGTIFRCAAIESFVTAIGTATDVHSGAPVTVQATLPWDQRLMMFDYLWRIRDTGTDREWCDQPQPSLFGGGGHLGPLWLPRRNILGGGTVIFASVEPFLSQVSQTSSSFFRNGSVQQYNLQMSFIGHQVPDRSAP